MKSFLVLLVHFFFICSFLKSFQGQLLPGEQQQFVDLHNYYRSTVIPSAANMYIAVWNDIVAQKAQNYANNVTNWSQGHSSSTYRTYDDGVVNGYHGENMAIGYPYSYETPYRVMYDWVVMERISPENDSSISNGGHLTQVVWWNSWQIGCGAKDGVVFSSYLGRLYVCQYGFGGNNGAPVTYNAGISCTQCPTGWICVNGTLCAPPETTTQQQTTESGGLQTTQSSVQTSSNVNSIVGTTNNASISSGTIAGIVVGFILGIALIIGIIIAVIFFRKRRNSYYTPKPQTDITLSPISSSPSLLSSTSALIPPSSPPISNIRTPPPPPIGNTNRTPPPPPTGNIRTPPQPPTGNTIRTPPPPPTGNTIRAPSPPPKAPTDAFTIGSAVLCKYSADGKFYRGIIIDISNGQYLVQYPDYDNYQEWRSADCLKK